MPILDFLKKKKPSPPVTRKPKQKGKEVEKPSQEEVAKKVKKSKKRKKKPELKKTSKVAYRILKGPQVTEKATLLSQQNQYVFKVYSRANKSEIKKAIKDVYGVNVVWVRIIKIPKKRRVLGRISGFRKGYKKAIIKIKEGEKIEILPK